MKRVLALLLTLALLVGVMPAAVAAGTQQPRTDAGTTVEAQELEGVSRLDEMEVSGAERAVEPLYAEDETVTVIVQLEEPAVMEHYDEGVSLFGAEEDLSAGEAVAAYLASDSAKTLSQSLLAEQSSVLSSIRGVVEGVSLFSDEAETGVEVVAQWTTAVNAMAVKVPYGKLDEIRNLTGVKRAYVERTFARPEEPVAEAGEIAGYSYDMVGIQEVWNAGYTGKGMLVAVLDTGLDLNWQAYADPHIVSVHEAFTEDSFKSADAKEHLRYNDTSLAAFLKANTLNAEFRGGETELTYDYNALYKNSKVPFAYDYADLDLNVMPTESDHGTHVSGTVAGYAVDSEGAVTFSGVAPDAQILSMKVFPDTASEGASEGVTVSALEDALKLGADVINLSLGSDNGFAEDDTVQEELYDTIRAAGILLMTSAGNADNSAYNNSYGGDNLTSDPEISMMSSPAVYDSNLAIASINSTVDVQTVFTWTDADGVEHEVAYNDPNSPSMKYKFVGQEPVSIIPVGGTGTWSDYYNAGFRSYYGYGEDKGVTGIALVQRGELSFADKILNAQQFWWSYYDSALGYYVNECPVKAVIVYDNVEGALVSMDTTNTSLTSCFISKADGEAIVAAVEAGCDVKISVREEDNVVEWEQAREMSEFTSWGAGPCLELKPEITAPGGNIWSSVTGGSSADGSTGAYGMMSGTSMAAPHMTGITALVEQYVQTKGLVSKQADADLTEQLMVSTAVPQLDENGVYHSPRRQGAGLVNAAAAIETPAYISVDGQHVGKLELKDDPSKTGSYELTFDVNNMTREALTYNVKAVLLRPDTATADSDWGERSVMLDRDVLIREVDLGTVTVPGMTTGSFSSATFSQTVSLTDAEKAELDSLFENGTYVEGFVILTDANGKNPQLGLPFLAFYGDWTAAPIFDRATWIDEAPEGGESFLDNEFTWWPSILGYFDGYYFYNLGQNPFDSFAASTQGEYLQENITISPSGFFRSVNDYELYQLRQAKLLVVEVHDKETGELYYRDLATYQFKTYYNSSNAWPVPCSMYYFTETDWSGTDLNGNVLPSGTQCVYTITAYGDGEYPLTADGHTDFEAIQPGSVEPTFNGHAMDKTGDVISFDVLVDTEAPKLVNNAVSVVTEEDGRTYITGTFTDDGSIASVEIRPLVKRSYKPGYGDPSYAEYGMDYNNPFYVEYIYDADVQEWTFKADVTEYSHTNEAYAGENYYYDFEWTGNVYIFGGDYGGNDRAYAVTVDDTPGLVLSTTSALLYVGEEFDLSVNNNTEDTTAPLTRSSSNPEVASVDEFGHIVALAPGQTTITVSNGTETVVCIVAVQEKPTEVIDFDLSIDHFSTLTPTGEIVVKVTNLYPADVDLTEIRWEVSEDDETAENYEGLITCERYTSDGLSGMLYLNYSTYDPYNMGYPQIPGGSGTLTVTLNGVSRSMTLDWEDLYKTATEEDLISDLYGNQQTIYVTQGDTATLIAKYNDSSAHGGLPVKLYTLAGANNYGYSNPTTDSVGLILDGAPIVGTGARWTGKLVNLEGYALPETIQVGVRYDYGYEYWWQNSEYYSYYSYDSTTGEIVVYAAPYGETNTLVIRADGVESEGNPAGETSGIEYEVPEPLYGPFNWEVTEGSGELTTAEGVIVDGYTQKNVAYYTPSEPGVSYLRATTKDGKYSVDFAVISEPVKAETLGLDVHNLTLAVGETQTLTPIFDPEPSLESDKELVWTSFNEDVATVDENGNVTGVSAGYAFLKVAVKTDTTVISYCVVEVLPGTKPLDPIYAAYKVEHYQEQLDGSYELAETEMQYGEVDTTVTAAAKDYDHYSLNTAMGVTSGEVFRPEVVDGELNILTLKLYYDLDRVTVIYTDGLQNAEAFADQVYTVPYGAATPAFDGKLGGFYCGGLVYAFKNWEPEVAAIATEDVVYTAKWYVNGGWIVDSTPNTPVKPTDSMHFTDVSTGDAFYDAVQYVYEEGLMNGVSDTKFAPESTLTRAMVVTILYRIEGEPATRYNGMFPDVPNYQWYTNAVEWAAKNNIVTGYTTGKFGPEDPVTREQLAAILYRYAQSKGCVLPDGADLSAYADGANVSAYAVPAVKWAVAEGILEAQSGKLQPRTEANRAQVAIAVAAFHQLYVK